MIYCDSSFLIALYVKSDVFHIEASRIAAKFTAPIPFTLLVELEVVNGIRRNFAAGLFEQKTHDAIFRQIADDETDGILARASLQQAEYYAKARELSKKFTPQISARSLDIMHVASALLLKATAFASFDKNQRVLVEKVGLNSLPGTIARRGKT